MSMRTVMTWVTAAAVAAASAVVAPATAAAATRTGALPRGDLMVANHSFEDGVAGWTTTCAASVSVTTDQHTDGVAALALTSTGSCATPSVLSSLVATTRGEKHTAWVDVLARGGSATVSLEFYNAAKRLVGRSVAVSSTTGRFRTLRPSGTAPDTTRYVAVRISGKTSSGGAIYADNVLLTRQFTDLGPQLTQDGYARAAAFATDKSGRALAYVVTDGGRGTPAHLTVIDASSGQLLRSLALNKGAPSGSWAVTAGATGTIYVASFQPGILWAYHPGAKTMIRVATMRGTQVPFALAPDATGGVYFGGYPDGIVYHYISGHGVRAFVSAKKLTGQNYVRSLAYDKSSRTVYVGVGARAGVLACDEATATCTNILPGAYRGQQFGYALSAAPGKVFAYLSPSSEMVVLDVTKRADRSYHAAPAATIAKVSYPGASAPIDGVIYYRGAGGVLFAYDLGSGVSAPTPVKAPGPVAWGSAVIAAPQGAASGDGQPAAASTPARTLLGAVRIAGGVNIYGFNPATGTAWTTSVAGLKGASVGIQSLSRGPDGRIYAGGYLTGGLAGYAPMRRDRSTTIPGVGQPEGMAFLGDKLYLGLYPGATIQAYAPSQPAKAGSNPAAVCQLAAQGQDRPYAMAAGGGKLYIGTMAGYGNLQGALTVYDPATGACTVHRNIVADQSIVSLVYSGGIVYGGSLVWGGLGSAPKQSRARLLRFDTRTGRATSIPVPIVAASLEGLVVAPNGNIWMMAQNWLLVYSPKSRKFVYKTQLFKGLAYPKMPPGATSRTSAYDAVLARGADGRIYGTLHGRYFFRLDAHNKPPVVLYQGAVQGLTTDAHGNLYFARSGDSLVRYVP